MARELIVITKHSVTGDVLDTHREPWTDRAERTWLEEVNGAGLPYTIEKTDTAVTITARD